MNCAELTKGLIADACKRAVSGLNGRILLMNYADIDRTATTELDGVVEALQLKEGKYAQAFEFKDTTLVAEHNLVKEAYLPTWEHIINAKILAKTQEAKNALEVLSKAKVVAIVENKEQGADGSVKYEMYGYDAGMELTESNNTTAFADGVVYNIKLASPANEKESSLPRTIFKTSAATTDTMIEGLLQAVTP